MSHPLHNTFSRCPHDNENPYAQISRELIRDPSISPNCRWLLIYLLSMKDGWVVSAKQIYSHVQDFLGRDKVWKVIAEAIDAGYIYREFLKIGNLRRGVRYYVSERPQFKVDTKNSNNFSGALKFSALGISEHKEEHSKECSSSSASPPKGGGAAPPPKVNSGKKSKDPDKPTSSSSSQVLKLFKTKLLEVNPHASINEVEDARVFDSMPALNQETINLEDVCAAIEHAFESEYWMDKIPSAQMMVKKFPVIFGQMISKRSKEAFRRIKKDNVSFVKSVVKDIRSIESDPHCYESDKIQAEKILRRLQINESMIRDTETQEEIKFSIDPELFKSRLSEVFGFQLMDYGGQT